MIPHLEFLMSSVYHGSDLHPEHLDDLRKSGLTEATIRVQKIHTVMPPAIFDALLGFRVPAAITSMYVLPFFGSTGTLLDHVRVRVFPALETPKGTIKYLQPRRSGVRIFFPVMALEAVMSTREPLWVIEGEKKSLAAAQLGLAAIGICGVEGWHARGSAELHPDLDGVPLVGRRVELVADSDMTTNPAVERAMLRAADVFRRHGARARLVLLPSREGESA